MKNKNKTLFGENVVTAQCYYCDKRLIVKNPSELIRKLNSDPLNVVTCNECSYLTQDEQE